MCTSVSSWKEMMYITGMTVQICQDLDCSPNEKAHIDTHTHASVCVLAYFVKVKCIQAGGNEKAPTSLLLRIIKHHAGSDNHNCQATDFHPNPSPRAFLRKCHFTFLSRVKLEAVHRDNLWILTLCVYCIDNTLPPISPGRPCPLALTSSLLSSPPLLSPQPHLSSRRPVRMISGLLRLA